MRLKPRSAGATLLFADERDETKHRKKVKKKTFVVQYHLAGTKKDQWKDHYKKYETLQAAQDAARLLQAEHERKVSELKKNGKPWTSKTYRAKEAD